MGVYKISLMEAYLIETVRASGVTNEELLEQVSKKDVTPWEKLNENWDYTTLIDLHEKDADIFLSVIHDGYQVKFLTINGLKNLLKMKFKITEAEYELTEQGIENLRVDEDTLFKIKLMLSPNWKVDESAVDSVNQEISITLV